LQSAFVSADFSPDGLQIITVSSGGRTGVWDVKTGLSLVELPDLGRVSLAQFSANGKRVVTVSQKDQSASTDFDVRVWDWRRGQQIANAIRHRDEVTSIAFSPDGERTVTVSADGTACMLNLQTGELLGQPLNHDGPLASARFSPDGRRWLTV